MRFPNRQKKLLPNQSTLVRFLAPLNPTKGKIEIRAARRRFSIQSNSPVSLKLFSLIKNLHECCARLGWAGLRRDARRDGNSTLINSANFSFARGVVAAMSAQAVGF